MSLWLPGENREQLAVHVLFWVVLFMAILALPMHDKGLEFVYGLAIWHVSYKLVVAVMDWRAETKEDGIDE